MAPVRQTAAHLAARALQSRNTHCYETHYGRRCEYSPWSGWGRWLLLGMLLGLGVLAYFLFSCMSARRRRKAGQQPFTGTAWAAPAGMKYGAPMQQTYQNPPPPNNAQYGQNADYYGANQYGNTTQYHAPVGAPPGPEYGLYPPPSGPPPAHVK